ncbi:hypothetical protein CFC21_040037 [Triticum aestivum]|uniref:Uncharacterized protein n=2 Tax=Triticum aestivum TaxID=4565 RepID=A0A9R1JSH9_WHEAT|nr:hypothetical protein CFC21_040037 [Triticum aestivum]CDM81441.1 unnamed protein product [Triticum aestivum]
MAFANGLKLAALCVLVLTVGQLMAVADASAPLMQSVEQERSTFEDCPCSPDKLWCCLRASGVAKPFKDCPCSPDKLWCCLKASRVAKPSEDCLCSPRTRFCCLQASEIPKASEN